MMMENEDTLYLCIYGYIDLKDKNIIKFWENFIEEQKNIRSNKNIKVIIDAYVNGDEELVKSVYSPEYFNFDNCKNYFGIESLYKSRSRLIKIIKNNHNNIILNEYNINESGKEIKKIIYDDSLPADYIYLLYEENVDIGYKDDLIVSNLDNLKLLIDYEKFYESSLKSESDYFKFISKKWHFYSFKIKFYNVIIKFVYRKIFNIVEKSKLFKILQKSNKKKLILLSEKFEQRFNPPIYTSENSVDINNSLSIFNLNKKFIFDRTTIFKYFSIIKNIRDKIRFLDVSDFKFSGGVVINPVKFIVILFINDDVEYGKNCNKVDKINSIFQGVNFDIYIIVNEDNSNSKEYNISSNIMKVLNSISDIDKYIDPEDICVLVPQDYEINQDFDKIYFHTLLKYIKYTKNSVIIGNNFFDYTKYNPSFPGLKIIIEDAYCKLLPIITTGDLLVNKLKYDNNFIFDKKINYFNMSIASNPNSFFVKYDL